MSPPTLPRKPSGRSGRAPSMAPEERRASIIAAARPLLLRNGPSVTTRQIAEAAGVAEGTLFRVFADKDTLLRAVLEDAVDPAPVERAIVEIDRAQPLEVQLEEAVTILQRRALDIWALITAIGTHPGPPQSKHPVRFHSLTELLEPHAARLRCDPRFAAEALRAMALAMTHPLAAPRPRPDAAAIVALFLDGVRHHDHPGGTPCHRIGVN
ncbi:MAG: TetR/AcrR family transcriptional regulator [Acidimicrobiia bacterium]